MTEEAEGELSLTEFESKKKVYHTGHIFTVAFKRDFEEAVNEGLFTPFTNAGSEQFFWRELNRLISLVYSEEFDPDSHH